MEDNWSACLQTLEGHTRPVSSVVFSGDSKMVASASRDQTVKIWDVNSGHCLQTLEGHTDSVNSVVFSGDFKMAASASGDETVKIWDVNSGHCLQTLEGHTNQVRSVVFSGDSKMVASASMDQTVKIWDVNSGHCLQTLEGHTNSVNSVVFSGDSKMVASASMDQTVKIWDVNSGHCLQTVNAGRSVRVKSFDPTNCYLELDSGTIHLSLGSCGTSAKPIPEAPTFQGCGISRDCVWITSDAANLLWLPPEYRPHAFDATQSSICLGCPTGRVLIFYLDF